MFASSTLLPVAVAMAAAVSNPVLDALRPHPLPCQPSKSSSFAGAAGIVVTVEDGVEGPKSETTLKTGVVGVAGDGVMVGATLLDVQVQWAGPLGAASAPLRLRGDGRRIALYCWLTDGPFRICVASAAT